MNDLDPSKSPHGSRFVRALVANSVVGALISVVCAAELACVFLVSPSIWETDLQTKLFAVSYIVWFWATAGWVLFGVGQLWQRLAAGPAWKGIVGRGSILAVFVIGILLYVISWGLLFRTGRMANIESIRFLLFNFSHLWDYFVAAEPIHLVILAGVIAGTVLLLPRLLNASATSQFDASRAQRITAWIGLTFLAMFCWNSLPAEQSAIRQGNRRRAISFELHPSFTYLVSYLSSTGEAIPANLDPSQLKRIEIDLPPTVAVSPSKLPSIVLIAVESLRHDVIDLHHQGQEVLPNINALAADGVNFTRAYAQSTHSDYADVCIVSSLYPLRTRRHHYFSASDPWPKTLIYDVLKPYGYATAVISSQNEAWGGMSHFLQSPNLDLFYHPETAEDGEILAASTMDPGFSHELNAGTLKAGKFTDKHTTSRAIEWIRHQPEDQPYFLSMNFQSSHFPYLIPESCSRPFQPCKLDATISFVGYPEEDAPTVYNAYLNAIHECDRQIGRLVGELKTLRRFDDTIIIVTGENGEAFHECGGSVGHAREPVDPAIHVACVIHAPRLLEARREDYPLEHVDLMPTLLSLLKIPPHPNVQGIDVFAKDRVDPADRLTFCHVNTEFAAGDAVILGGRWKLWVDRLNQQRRLYDAWSDPNEEHDLSQRRPELLAELEAAVQQWRQQQLSYYHYPQYYLSYYPPAPPKRQPRPMAAATTVPIARSELSPVETPSGVTER